MHASSRADNFICHNFNFCTLPFPAGTAAVAAAQQDNKQQERDDSPTTATPETLTKPHYGNQMEIATGKGGSPREFLVGLCFTQLQTQPLASGSSCSLPTAPSLFFFSPQSWPAFSSAWGLGTKAEGIIFLKGNCRPCSFIHLVVFSSDTWELKEVLKCIYFLNEV